jgi:hypothetical protein
MISIITIEISMAVLVETLFGHGGATLVPGRPVTFDAQARQVMQYRHTGMHHAARFIHSLCHPMPDFVRLLAHRLLFFHDLSPRRLIRSGQKRNHITIQAAFRKYSV